MVVEALCCWHSTSQRRHVVGCWAAGLLAGWRQAFSTPTHLPAIPPAHSSHLPAGLQEYLRSHSAAQTQNHHRRLLLVRPFASPLSSPITQSRPSNQCAVSVACLSSPSSFSARGPAQKKNPQRGRTTHCQPGRPNSLPSRRRKKKHIPLLRHLLLCARLFISPIAKIKDKNFIHPGLASSQKKASSNTIQRILASLPHSYSSRNHPPPPARRAIFAS